MTRRSRNDLSRRKMKIQMVSWLPMMIQARKSTATLQEAATTSDLSNLGGAEGSTAAEAGQLLFTAATAMKETPTRKTR